MAINTLDNLTKKERNLAKEYSIAKMVINILEIGSLTILMGKEFIPLVVVKCTKVL